MKLLKISQIFFASKCVASYVSTIICFIWICLLKIYEIFLLYFKNLDTIWNILILTFFVFQTKSNMSQVSSYQKWVQWQLRIGKVNSFINTTKHDKNLHRILYVYLHFKSNGSFKGMIRFHFRKHLTYDHFLLVP